MDAILNGYRVLDLCTGGCLVCGKILADLGADVIKIEPPGGDPTRNIGPFFGGIPHRERSLYWFAFNTNKRGMTLKIESPEGKGIFRKLVETADVVLENFDVGYLDKLGLGYDDLKAINPKVIMTSVTPFGQTGPYKDYKGADMVVWALGGLMNLCGDPDRQPVQVSLPQAYIAAGTYAAEGTMVALFERENSGLGQQVDVSAQATITWFISELIPFYNLLGQDMKRAGGAITRAGGLLCPIVYKCQDGYISYMITAGLPGAERNEKMVLWLEEEGLATDYLRQKDWVNWDWVGMTKEELEKISKPVSELFIRYKAQDLYDEAIRWGVSLFPVSTSQDIMGNAQLEARGFWTPLYHEALDTTLTYPGAFALIPETPLSVSKRAPLIGEHNQEVYVEELGLTLEEMVSLQGIGVV